MDAYRYEYESETFDVADADPDPIVQFERWYEQISATSLPEPNAMVLATASEDGAPSARVVLLKGIERGGFMFYTNRSSVKGRHLAENPRAALCFYWPPLHRQVRLEGAVEYVDDSVSDSYFASRPEGARIGAIASPQSQVIVDRAWLDAQVAAVSSQGSFGRPAHWGGYRVVPHRFEFWQGRPDRLHDRIAYVLVDDTWRRERLAP